MFIQSDDADVKELAVFETPLTNTLDMERHFLNFHPVSGITPTTNVIHFSVKGLSLKYVDLQCSRLHIRLEIWMEEYPIKTLFSPSTIYFSPCGSKWKCFRVVNLLVQEAATTITRA